ncbi:phosphoribosyl-AMP cyclohydrolase [Spirosoma aerolatum]|uniref:phosphoribosyl-AMP cyclohydrolase n=1 Tax=Spirosoma aerolatum TaxID=1211326 RepID=UPI0009ACF649|nr:phosphoribosyl-AMP cyclohydrolase [Spirosoma aerolatum]
MVNRLLSSLLTDLEETTTLQLQFAKRGGLLPVAVQESRTGQILMLASVNAEALSYSLTHRRAAFWSTSRNELWVKGLTSGDTLRLDAVLVDCDQDALVYQVTLEGDGVCHTYGPDGKHRKACFYRQLNPDTETLDFLPGTSVPTTTSLAYSNHD